MILELKAMGADLFKRVLHRAADILKVYTTRFGYSHIFSDCSPSEGVCNR